MKAKNLILVLLFAMYAITAVSQKVVYANKEYKIKGDKIFFDGEDVSDTFSEADRTSIFQKLKDQKAKEKENRKAEKKAKKEERKVKKEEKEKKAQEKAKDDYEDAVEKVEKATAKFERLKRKGKLSPNDEVKWLDKIAKLKEKAAKKKRKL